MSRGAPTSPFPSSGDAGDGSADRGRAFSPTTPPLPQLAPVAQWTVAAPLRYLPRMWSVASDGPYVYALLYHARPTDENDTAGPGELVVLRRHGLTELRRLAVGLQPRRVLVDTHNGRVHALNRLAGRPGAGGPELERVGARAAGGALDSWYAEFRDRLHSQETTADWRFRYVRDHLRLARG